MAAVPPEALENIHQLLILCGINTQEMREKLIDLEGLSSVHDFAQITDSEVDNMAKHCEARVAAQRVSFGLVQIKKFKAVCFWARKVKSAGKEPDIAELDARKLAQLIDKMNLA